jgi:SAM-dependent methyltransferase
MKRARITDSEATPEATPHVDAPLDPRLYLCLHTGNIGDVGYYVEILEALKAKLGDEQVRVLEVGCGAGRVTLSLAALGAHITGIDTHPERLELCEVEAHRRGLSAHVHLMLADMRDFTLDATFHLALIPYNGLYCLLTREEQVQCLTRIAQHLCPDAPLLFDGYLLPDPEEYIFESGDAYEPLIALELPPLNAQGHPQLGWSHERMEIDDDSEEEEEDSILGDVVAVEERDVHQQEAQRCDVHYRYTWPEGAVREEVIRHRYLYPQQLSQLFIEAGMTFEGVWADFTDLEVDEDTEQWVARGRKVSMSSSS